MKSWVLSAALMMAVPANAAVTPVSLDNVINSLWVNEGFTTIPTGAVTLGGTPFLITDYFGYTAFWRANDFQSSLTIPVSIFGATTGFTLINSFWGQPDISYSSVTFNATGGVSTTFALVGNVDMRDYLQNNWTNTINNTTTVEVFSEGDRRLDRQTFALPTAFRTQTLTSVVFNDVGADGFSRLTLTGLAIASVPEPQSWAMLIMGFGLIGTAMRRRASVPA